MKYLEFNTPAQKQAGDWASDHKLHNLGLAYLDRVYWNLPNEALYEEAIFRNEGHLTTGGAFVCPDFTGNYQRGFLSKTFCIIKHFF